MGRTNEPSPAQSPNEALLAFESRLSALERRMAEQSEPSDSGGPDEPPLGLAELSEELRHHRSQLRDYEKALVERIADVDDDRRATASRLQRAWQTQRDEIDERLRRHAGLLGGLLLLFALVFVVALVLVYRQTTTGQPETSAEVSEIRAQLARFSETGAVNEQAQEKLDRLTAELGEIASALGRVGREGEQAVKASAAAERAARREAEERLVEQIRRVGEKQGTLAGDLASLRSALQALEASGGEKRNPTDTPAATTTAVPPAVAPESGPEPEADSKALSRPVSEDATEEIEEDIPVPQTGAGRGASAPEQSENAPSGSEETLVAGGDIYALQLIGFFRRESLEEFVARTALPARVYVMRQTYKGRPWYALIYDLYDDYAAAEGALSRLPADLVALKPWIRPLSEVTELQILETGREREQQSELH